MTRREVLKQGLAITGYTLSASALAQVWTACQSEVQQSDWVPSFFSSDQVATIAEVAETIIPETDTPGAKGIQLERFIDAMVQNVYDEKGQQALLKGMQEFEQTCEEANGVSFVDSSSEQRESFLLQQERQSPLTVHTIWGGAVEEQPPLTFYRQLKSLVVMGYFTSEQVGKHLLTYVPIPGKQQGCVPLSEVNTVYSL